MQTLRKTVFWPSFGLLSLAIIYSIANPEGFLDQMKLLNAALLSNCGPLFSLTSFLMLLLLIALFVSPLGRIRIGGPKAEPILNRWKWFSITICTTIATGILFWGTAEPLYHYGSPPASAGLAAESPEAAQFALSTLYLHWSFTPYAIYSLPALVFALAHYNYGAKYSLTALLFPFLKTKKEGGFHSFKGLSSIIDSLCLFALVAGMASSLGAGLLTLAGGLESQLGWTANSNMLLLICIITVLAFIISAATGLKKGIQFLSSINIWAFIFIALSFLFLGPGQKMLPLIGSSLGEYFGTFLEKNLYNIYHPKEKWANSWTTFYWANWMAWAPITALFLGKIARGYTLREMLLFNWILPSIFALIWMSIFGGSALWAVQTGEDLLGSLSANGAESIIYELMAKYAAPLMPFMALLFIFTVFLSYVTAADSNTEAMGSISMDGLATGDSPKLYIKVIWGLCIGAAAYIMVSQAGIKGIKMLSNLGGLPALLLLLTASLGLLYWMFKKRFGF
ncbi:BCCT family transporter [Saprospira sp. CCB-QB6]|uniref:BCCT family transporter n=1 Tax=Saprospira sp. CCB-QB6 TaxID=3023936 RepID=UPI00234A62B6|nr:BCCT family transporter [Saprospira sp. CCB-QB6]WCL81328.1 BCCT family transporter [Saprospira sp. CCB-QB6]